MTINENLTFKQHIENLYRKIQHELYTLRHMKRFLTIEKTKILGNAFTHSQFNYAPLLWMFYRKTVYSQIEKIHQKTLKVIYKSNDADDNILLQSNIKVCKYIKVHKST